MDSFAGNQLKEMTEMRFARKQHIVLISSGVATAIFLVFALYYYFNHQPLSSGLLLLSGIATLLNMLSLNRHRELHTQADLILSLILLTYAVALVSNTQHELSHLLWLYPLITTLVMINPFRMGLVYSATICLAMTASILLNHLQTGSNHIAHNYFLMSLFALTIICNTASFFFSRAINYIHTLYQEGIEELAYLDPLTGLANRWSFETWATEKLKEQQESNSITALVFLDIDNFKRINDNYGHDVGDQVLKHFAHRLRNNIRNKDRTTNQHDYSIARFAGDEFVLLLYGIRNLRDLDNILSRICYLFIDRYPETDMLNNLTVSIGVAIYPKDAITLHELTRCADKAMYAAKHGGKNQYRYYHDAAFPPAIETVLDDTPVDAPNVTPLKKAH
ncbi:GGDEF domain-containing protein [Vibrio tarriae]|uniref:GGDEF domain-containing protein n=1 Tax=Vibrio tarriae TaxID=2014742 RepID=UPI000DE376D2|nr:GGDEF domain-containing protein [Vibrio tarriae]QEO47309.1 GGDEF domain-containing protein [Vibrio cholerae]RBM31494.1 GGDEF domain-containing protein [Vibrio tarriae]RBM35253.1 GGDEF domain-containing protein [Vibrio tarriae]RBM39241.1 GGDEF domain-containing protein [Vibrio tarriae]RBM48575.1 GGDEF domain-containing protein [Vibrio tarriae]